MGKGKKIEGGSGGKKGHSNMSHWSRTEEIKKETKKARRENDKKEIKKSLNENLSTKFESFLEAFKGSGQDDVLDIIKSGFNICFESEHFGESDTIREYMAKTFFASAWGDYEKEINDNEHGGEDIMNILPDDIPESAYLAADKLINHLQKKTGKSLADLYNEAANTEGKHYREPTEDDFGFSLAMQSLDNEGWSANHPKLTFEVPRIEYSYYDLPNDEYPMDAEGETDPHNPDPEGMNLSGDNEFEHLNDEPLDSEKEHFYKEPDPDDHFKPATLKSNLEAIEKIKKFEAFLESLKGSEQDKVLNVIKEGFKACFEEIQKWESSNSELQDLQNSYSDTYKDMNGFRPRFMSPEQWNSIDWLKAGLDSMYAEIKTPEYQEKLRQEDEDRKLEDQRYEEEDQKRLVEHNDNLEEEQFHKDNRTDDPRLQIPVKGNAGRHNKPRYQ